jgi:hypothetical protein
MVPTAARTSNAAVVGKPRWSRDPLVVKICIHGQADRLCIGHTVGAKNEKTVAHKSILVDRFGDLSTSRDVRRLRRNRFVNRRVGNATSRSGLAHGGRTSSLLGNLGFCSIESPPKEVDVSHDRKI